MTCSERSFSILCFLILFLLPDTAAGFGGEVVRRKLLYCKGAERLFRLIRVGDEVAFGETFGRAVRIPP
jgi:hypothetical protein